MSRNRGAIGITALAACSIVVTGCGTGGATKAGGSADPVTLRLGTDDSDTSPMAPVIEAFAERVRDLSDGSLIIEPRYSVASTEDGTQLRDWDQVVAGQVADGELDMGLIPARAWDVLGVATLRPFSLPFLVTSEEHLDAIAGSDLTDDLLAGLESEGVTGLTLIPEGVRHAFSFGEPLTSPDAFAGTTIRASHSDTGWAVYEAWGATAEDLTGAEFDEGALSGSVAGADSSFARAEGLPGPVPAVAGNLVTSANAQTLVVSTEALDELSDDQSDVLRRAAADVRGDVLAEPAGESGAAADFCDRGGQIVTASEAELAALEAAAQPVYDELNRDPATAALISAIREIVTGLPAPEPLATCQPDQPAQPVADQRPDTEGIFPEGVYRARLTQEDLVAAGMTEEEAEDHGGTWDMTFTDGRHLGRDVRDIDGQVTDQEGSYCVADGRVAVALDPDGCSDNVLFTASWTLDGRELRFTDVDGHDLGGGTDTFAQALWGSEPWIRID